MPHLDDGLIHALLDGEIPSRELEPLQAHLRGCAECRARLAEEQELMATADGLIEALEVPPLAPSVPVPVRKPPRAWPRQVAWAATVLAAAGLGYAARGGAPEPLGENAQEVASGSGLADSQGPALDSAQTLAAPPAVKPEAAREGRPAETVARRRQQEQDGRRAGVSAPTLQANASAPPADSAAAQRAAAGKAAAPPEPTTAPAPAPAQALGAVTSTRLRELSARRDLAAAPATEQASFDALGRPVPITLPEAIRLLGGSLRLVDGLVPDRLEARGTSVRVVYRTGYGELVLSQSLENGALRFALTAPAGFPADSLATLRARVRE